MQRTRPSLHRQLKPVRRFNLGQIIVRPRPGRKSQGLLSFAGIVVPCALGKGGVTALKREGDGATPLAAMRVLSVRLRHGRHMPVPPRLSWARTHADDGWCDAVGDANYNRPVKLPFGASHEKMQRSDHLYDAVVVLDWNIRPRIRNCGSAIFLHVARPGLTPTEGCVAVPAAIMRRLLPLLSPRTVLEVRRS